MSDFLDLRIWAESFHDAQENRKALMNRMERGDIDAELLIGHRANLEASEHDLKLAMIRSYRQVVRTYLPAVEEWQKHRKGIGEHLLARLLGHLGHPVVAQPYQWMDTSPEGHSCIPGKCGKRHLVALEPFERTVGQLWQYCGHGAPDKRKKGMSQEEAMRLGNPTCKMLVHLLAESCVKAGIRKLPHAEDPFDPETRKPISYYGQVWYDRRVETWDRDLSGCGCKDGCSDGHKQADALRIVGKEILRDLWIYAQGANDTQSPIGVGGPA